MFNVLRENKLLIVYAKHFLFFEWMLEKSDLRESSYQLSSEFNMEDGNSSHLEFVVSVSGNAYLWLYFTKAVENCRYMTDIRDSNSSFIGSRSKSESKFQYDLIPDIWEKISSSTVYPITISCTVRTSNVLQFETPIVERRSGMQELCSDFKNLLDQEINTDIALKVDDDIIKAHKLVLVARSSVFRKMFHHDSCEAVKNTVVISDIKSATMKRLVHFLYTAEMEKCDSVDEIMELYFAADKYEVLSLRQDCANELLSKIRVDNACSLFALARRHNDKEFLKKLMIFISKNLKSVVNTDAVDELSKDDMKLLMCEFCNSNFCSN